MIHTKGFSYIERDTPLSLPVYPNAADSIDRSKRTKNKEQKNSRVGRSQSKWTVSRLFVGSGFLLNESGLRSKKSVNKSTLSNRKPDSASRDQNKTMRSLKAGCVVSIVSEQRLSGTSQLTMLNSFHTGSLGCAPTPSQYFARDRSRAISLYARALAFSLYRLVGCFGMGLKVPITSRGFAPRADLEKRESASFVSCH